MSVMIAIERSSARPIQTQLAEQIREDTPRFAAESKALGDQVFREFLGLFHHRSRRITLPSR